MKMRLKGPLKIKGDSFEQHAITIITILFAGVYILLLSSTSLPSNNPLLYVLFLGLGVETVLFSILGKKLPPAWKIVPLAHYSLGCTIHLFIAVSTGFQAKASIGIYFAECSLEICFLWKAVFDLISFSMYKVGQNSDNDPNRFVGPLLWVFIFDFLTSFYSMTSGSDGRNAIFGFLARIVLYIVLVLVSVTNISVNVRRILRLVFMCAVSAFFFAVPIGLFFFIIGEPLSFGTLLVSSAVLAPIFLLMGSEGYSVAASIRHGHRTQKQQTYHDEGDSEANIVSTASKNSYLMDQALSRNYLDEYTGRMWNNAADVAEISRIQSRLEELRKQRENLRGKTNEFEVLRRKAVEAEAANLLGKLNLWYDFSNGFNRYRMGALCACRALGPSTL